MRWLQTRANTKTQSKDTKYMQTETEENDNGDGNSGGEKTWATFTFDNGYTRGITKTFRHKLKIVVWGSFKNQYTLQCIQCHGNSNVLSSQLLSSVLLSHMCCCQQYETHLGLCVKCPIFSLVFTKFRFFVQILVKVSNIKFHKDLSSGSQADTCGQVGAELINVDK